MAVAFQPHFDALRKGINFFYHALETQSPTYKDLDRFANAVEKLQRLVGKPFADVGADALSAVESIASQLSQNLSEMGDAYAKLSPQLIGLEESGDPHAQGIMTGDLLDFHVKRLLQTKGISPLQYIMSGLQEQIMRNFRDNFQVGNLSRLCRSDSPPPHFTIEGVGELGFRMRPFRVRPPRIGEPRGMDISSQGLRIMQRYSDVLYLDSPVFWRLKNTLEIVRETRHRSHRRILDAPKYFYDMAFAIKEEYTEGIDFSDVSESIADEIGGRVVVDPATGSMFFDEKDVGMHPLSLTAMGVANFGMFGLLIEKNLLEANTFLFVDEPEAHLHPAWQVAMTKVLIHLAERGVKVVMATHSADILKWLQVHAKENPDAEKIIALNHFQKEGTVESGDDFLETLSGIQDDLTKPYQHMFIRGLRA